MQPLIQVAPEFTRVKLPGDNAARAARIVRQAKRRSFERQFAAKAFTGGGRAIPVVTKIAPKAAAVSFKKTAARGGATLLSRLTPALKPVTRFVPFLGVALVAYDGVKFLEELAPGVHQWLRGGWKGVRVGQQVISNEQGKCPAQYAISSRTYRSGTLVSESTATLTGPIAGIAIEEVMPGFEQVIVRYGPGDPAPFNTSLNGVFGQTGTLSFEIVSMLRTDGLPDDCGRREQFSGPTYPATPQTSAGAPVQAPRTPTAPGTPTPTDPTQSPNNNRDGTGFTPLIPSLIPAIARVPDSNTQPEPQPKIDPFPSDPGTCTTGCNATLRDGQSAINDKLNQQLEALNALLNSADLLNGQKLGEKLSVIDEKLGPQLTNSRGTNIGISGFLQGFQGRMNQWFTQLGVDRIMNALTLAASLHNAAMLSNNLGQTLFQTISSVLASVGIKDADGQPLNITSIVGKAWQDFVTGIIGAENFTSLSATFTRANRIYQAGANIINSLQSIRFSVMSALEALGSLNGRVANALKKFGVVGDSAYPFFNPNPNYDNAFFQAIERAEQTISQIDQIASEVLSVQDTVTQLGMQKTELETQLTGGTEKPLADNAEQKAKDAAAKAASASVDINPTDLIKPST